MNFLGVVLSFGALVSYFFLAVHVPVLRDQPILNLPLCLVGLGLSVAGTRRTFSGEAPAWRKGLTGAGLVLCLAVNMFFVWWTVSLSYLPALPPEAMARTTFPDFDLVSHDGSHVRRADLAGRSLIVVFYRGHW